MKTNHKIKLMKKFFRKIRKGGIYETMRWIPDKLAFKNIFLWPEKLIQINEVEDHTRDLTGKYKIARVLEIKEPEISFKNLENNDKAKMFLCYGDKVHKGFFYKITFLVVNDD